MEFILKPSTLLITTSVGGGLIAFYFRSKKKKKEEEIIITEKDIWHDLSIDEIVIDVDGTDVILSASAEELLRRLSTKRQNSSLLYN